MSPFFLQRYCKISFFPCIKAWIWLILRSQIRKLKDDVIWDALNGEEFGCHGYCWQCSCLCFCSPFSISIPKGLPTTLDVLSACTMCATAISPPPTSALCNVCFVSFRHCHSSLRASPSSASLWWHKVLSPQVSATESLPARQKSFLCVLPLFADVELLFLFDSTSQVESS